MSDRTFVLIKPDGVQRALVGEILRRIENAGLKIVALKMVNASHEQAGKHYADDEAWLQSGGEKTLRSAEKQGLTLSRSPLDQGRWVRQALIDFITMSPSVAVVVDGHGAVEKVRTLCGGTNPQECPPGTIRGDFSIDSYHLADLSSRALQDLIHASDSGKEAEREIAVWFSEEEIHAWKRVDEDLMYRKGP